MNPLKTKGIVWEPHTTMSAAGQQLKSEIEAMPYVGVVDQRVTPADCICSQQHLEDMQRRHGGAVCALHVNVHQRHPRVPRREPREAGRHDVHGRAHRVVGLARPVQKNAELVGRRWFHEIVPRHGAAPGVVR